MAANSLTEDQARQMDKFNFPEGLLSSQVMLSHLPTNIKTWGQLKDWVAQHMNSMPGDILEKLKGLQGLHFRNMQQIQQSRQSQVPGAPSIQKSNSHQPGPAPEAPMLQSRNSQIAPPGLNPSQLQFAGPSGIPNPTAEEVATARTRLPENMKHLSDEDITRVLMGHRMKMIMKAQENRAAAGGQQLPFNNIQRPQQATNQQFSRQVPQSNLSTQQSSTQQQPQAPNSQNGPKTLNQPVGKAPSQARPMVHSTSQGPTMKGNKRKETEDVFEVPNPNLAQQQQQHQRAPAVNKEIQVLGQQPLNATMTNEQLSSMPQQQRAIYEAQLRRQASQQGKMPSLQQSVSTGSNDPTAIQMTEDERRRNARIYQILRDVVATTPNRPPIQMDEQTRQKMITQLSYAKIMVQKMEEALPSFFKMYGDEKATRELITTVCLINAGIYIHN